MQQSSTASDILVGLQQALTDASKGQARAVLLEGAAGLGKSRILRTFASMPKGLVLTAEGKHWLNTILGACKTQLEIERDSAFLEAVRRIAPSAGYAQVAQAPDFADQNALWNAVAFALERLAKRVGGLTLLLEDAHSASQDDLGALRAFYRRAMIGHAPVLVVLTSRPTETDLLEGFAQDAALANGLEPSRLVISKLDQMGVGALTRQHLHSDYLPENLSAWLYARAEGNPLHTLELLRFLQDGGALEDLGISWVFEPPKGKAIPKSLNAILTARVANAKRDSRVWKALAALSVLERECSLTDWAKLCHQTESTLLEVANRLEYMGLVRENLVTGQTVYAVAHPLYPPLVRAQLETAALEQLHRNAVNIAASIGERARHARTCHSEQALGFSQAALEEALQRFAHEDVIEHAESILIHELPASTRVQVQAWLAKALFIRGQTKRVLELTEQANQNVALLDLAFHVHMRLRNFGAALEAAQKVKALLEVDSQLSASLNQALALMHLERLEEAHNVVLELLKQFPEPCAQQGKVLDVLSDIVYSQGNLRASLEIGIQAANMLREFHDFQNLAITLSNLGGCCTHFGLWEQGNEVLNEAIDLFTTQGQFHHVMFARNNLGFLMLASAKYAEVRGLLLQVHQQAHRAKEIAVEAAALSSLTDLEWQSGNFDLALAYHKQSILLGSRESESLIDSAHLEAIRGNLQVALELIDTPQVTFHINKSPKRARIALLAGRFEQALEILKTAENPENHDTLKAQLRLLRGLTEFKLNRVEQAKTDLIQAKELAQSGQNQAVALEAKLALSLMTNQPQAAQQAIHDLEQLDARGHVLILKKILEPIWVKTELSRKATANPEHSTLITLGAFGLERDGKTTPWKASKTRKLLAVLLIAHLREGNPKISKAQIIDALWQDETGDANTESKFRMTVKRLREALGSAASIHNQDGMYELRDLKADVVFFLESLERLDFDAALGWYKGEFLPNIDLPELELIRAQLWRRFRDTALQLSFETPNVNLLEKLHHLEPLDVGILERYLQLISGNAFRVNQVLARARNLFERETGEVPPELMM